MIVVNDYQQVYTQVLAGAVDLSALVLSVDLPDRLSQARTWTVTLDNSAGTYTPDNYRATLWGVDWTIVVTAKDTVNATPIDEVLTLTYLVPQDAEFSLGDTSTLIINGTDKSDPLFKRNQTKETRQSTDGDTLFSQDAIRTILDEYSVVHVTDDASPIDTVTSDNYPIRMLHFQGELPIDVIKKIMNVTWADWYFSGDTMHIEQFDAVQDHAITDYTDFADLKIHESTANVITRATATRTLECGNTALDAEGNTAGVFGAGEYVTQSLDFAVLNAVPAVVQSAFCIIDQWSVGDAEGNWALWPEGPPGGEITQVKFRVQAQSGITEAQGAILHWHVVVKGDKPQSGTEWGDLYETDYTVTRRNVTLETELNDDIPGGDPIYEPLIPNQTWAETYLDRKLTRSALNRRRITATLRGTALELTPGDTVLVTCGRYAMMAEPYFVDSVTHTVSAGTAHTSFTGGLVRSDTFETVEEEEGGE